MDKYLGVAPNMADSTEALAEKKAIRVLTEISNQQTAYKWTNREKEQRYTTEISKRKSISDDINKPVTKLPFLLNKKMIDENYSQENDQGSLAIHRKYQKKNMNSVRGFFGREITSSNPLRGGPYKIEYVCDQQEAEKARSNELQLVKSWLNHKRMECKSLNQIIRKFRDDSGKFKSSVGKLPFTIKSFHENK